MPPNLLKVIVLDGPALIFVSESEKIDVSGACTEYHI